MSVANPWMLASPEPTTSHAVDGSPAFRFSQTVGLMLAPQGDPCELNRSPLKAAAARTSATRYARREFKEKM